MNLQDLIISIVAKINGVPKEEVSLSHKLKEDLGMDSLDSLELITEIEQEFSLYIPEETEINSVGEIVQYVERHTSDKN
ncbi:acyl carrier protein [Cytophagaceae bacterium ABcell3]|nr:acyl carrier protein [Cytophagaceae bacterium ABcell3]